MSEFEGKSFHILDEKDANYVVGGAKLTNEVDPEWERTSGPMKCDCNKFEPLHCGVNLNICDNCKFGRKEKGNDKKTYCCANRNTGSAMF